MQKAYKSLRDSYAKKHGIEVHGYTEETWNEEISKNKAIEV
jgi:hypothetical protein